jgi:RND superfamily putative drug exporter
MDTAGRAVMLAGSTVIISMLGLFAMGLSFMRGASVVTIVAVIVVLIASITLFPALLGIFGRRIDSLRLPLRRRSMATATVDGVTPGWLRWSKLIERNRVIATVIGVVILLGLASPFLGVRFGFPDAGNDAVGTSTRTAYDLSTDGFGAGANGPLLLVADVPSGMSPSDASAAVGRAAREVTSTSGVACR